MLTQKDSELSQYNWICRDCDPNKNLGIASEAMQVDLEILQKSKRISKTLKDKCDLLIYLLWESGRFANQEFGLQFGISYSNVNRRNREMRKKFDKDQGIKKEYKK